MQTEKQKNELSSDQHIQSYQSEDTRDQNNLQDTWHKEITPHTMTTMTSWKDRINFREPQYFPAFKGLKVVISENQENQSYQL